MHYRRATARDIDAIAELHADSWRRHYRGAYSDAYLDGDVVADRMTVWTERLAEPQPDTFTIVAEHDGGVVGFAHTALDGDAAWGALLDNLHVVYDLKGQGVGTGLMSETARALLDARSSSGLYLWVLEQNKAAQVFYQARGGTCAGAELGGPFPGGGTATCLRYVWPDPTLLLKSPY